jgi:signal transduction histidine kinase
MMRLQAKGDRMSASAEVSRRSSAATRSSPRDVRLYFWFVSLVWIALLTWGLWTHIAIVVRDGARLVPWILSLALVNLLPLNGWYARMVPDLPIGAAAALILSPLEAGLVGFASAFDSKEFQRQITLTRAIFNKAQLGLIYMGGSWLVHAIDQDPALHGKILLLSFVALTSMVSANYFLIGVGITIEHGYPLKEVFQRLRLGAPVDFAVAMLAWGVLAAMLAALYVDVHWWVLLAFVAPTLLARQALMRSEMLLEARRAYASRDQTIAHLERRVHNERTDERRLIAADLHDEVLQPLFKVTLMAQVLKADLATGRLLEMDEDLPELLAAAELAAGLLRQLIGDLRKSSLGRCGLTTSLQSLVRELQSQTSAHLSAEIGPVDTSPERELAIYQIAKEGIVNALHHSRASSISVELVADSSGVRLVVSDDGVGFDPFTDKTDHYGLRIVRERATMLGAQLFVDAAPGLGCRLTLLVPP